MLFDKKELRKLLKEQNVKDLDDFNALMSNVSKEVVEALLEGEIDRKSVV